MKHHLRIVILGAAVALVLWVGVLMGDNPKYVEDFTTTQYKDTLNTTAWWDTVAGEIKLFPFVPTLAGSYNTSGWAIHVTISGDYAFVGDDVGGLLVIDISDPTAPASVGSYNTPGNARGVAIAGDYAYVADWDFGLQVIDISNPTAPSLAGSYDTPGSARAVVIAGDYAYVADWDFGLQVIDISNPTAPSLAGSYDTPGTAYGVAIAGDYAYVGDGASNSLQVIDISDPTSPDSAGSCNTLDYAKGVTISGDHAYVAVTGSGLQVIDISDPTVPTSAGSYDTPDNAFNVVVSGDYAYVADWGSGLQVIDISDPTAPMSAGSVDTPSGAYSVAISGNHAYVADDYSGLQVIEIGDPIAPWYAGSYNTPGDAFGVAISGDYAFVAASMGGSGLQVIDISDPTAPSLAGSYNTPSGAYCIAISGDYAYVPTWNDGLYVIDISDPTAPSLAGSCDTLLLANDIAISGDYAYVAGHDYGLLVIDISDPTNPDSAGNYVPPYEDGYGVAISGDYAYLAAWNDRLQVIDISDPTAPSLAGSYYSLNAFTDVAISGDYAYVATTGGLQVIDISDPTAPSYAGRYDMPEQAKDVAISGDYAYVGDNYSGLQVIDISNPTAPTYAGSYNTPGQSWDVAISGNYAYVADRTSLRVIQVFQREFDPYNNVGWSLAVDASNDTIFGIRLTTAQTNTITWELSADGGTSWEGIASDGDWNQLAAPGIDLVWRSTHAWAAAGVNPAVTQLEIDWLIEPALVDSIVDVPNDQGGWVRAHFTRSGRDFSGEPSLPIENYGIWQRVDDPALVATLKIVSTSEPKKQAEGDKPHLAGALLIEHQGRTYVQSRPSLAASSFPSGMWEWVATVPAIQQDGYVARVPTVADSSGSGMNYAVFVITAHTTTPSVWYVSEPDSGYSVDNIAPEVPTSFAVAYNTGSGNQLSWDPCPDEDFQYFCVYRSNDPDFVPVPGDLVHTTTTTSWNDPEYDGWNVYYKITACDYVGNESDPASAGTVTAVAEPVIPQAYALYQNVPNPFNPATVIRYDVPAGGGKVTLRIYDVSGRLVRTLLDGTEGPGAKTVTWIGRNDRGRPVSSGVYFYRMTAPGFEMTHKMVLLQ